MERTSTQRAKLKYKKSPEGKACDKRYYQRHAETLRQKQQKYNENRRVKEKMYRKFYNDYINQHPEFEP